MTQCERYEFQKTEMGQISNDVADDLKQRLEKRLQIPKGKIKTGCLTALVCERTGKRRFIER